MLVPLGGARAVLWHQGECDHRTDSATYQTLLTNLIVESRRTTNVNIPWVVAMVSYVPAGDPPLSPGLSPLDPRIRPKTIRLAQYSVTRSVPFVYLGPTTDDLGPTYRDSSRIHMNVAGLQAHGAKWVNVLLNATTLIPVPITLSDGSFGQTGLLDIPVPGDYEGVGHTEMVVFRPADATWWVVDPLGQAPPHQLRNLKRVEGVFGQPGLLDMPGPGVWSSIKRKPR